MLPTSDDDATSMMIPDSATAALAMTAWQMIAVLSLSLVWLLYECHGDVSAMMTQMEQTARMGVSTPEVGMTLGWTGARVPLAHHHHSALSLSPSSFPYRPSSAVLACIYSLPCPPPHSLLPCSLLSSPLRSLLPSSCPPLRRSGDDRRMCLCGGQLPRRPLLPRGHRHLRLRATVRTSPI